MVFFQQISPPKKNSEVFATKSKVKMPSRPWMGERPPVPPPETKQQRLVVVRGRVQTKASVESEDSKRDAEALVPISVSEKAVFVERTQTVCCNSEPLFLNFPSFLGKMLKALYLKLSLGKGTARQKLYEI